MRDKNIILIGFMGTGKTVTGRVLAERTGMKLIDMDSLIETEQKKTIPEIFAQDGEPAFRQMERELVQKLSKRSGLIISTGGGIVLNPDNVADFEKSGLVVCLTASPETIFKRVEKDTSRPLLSGDKKTQIYTLLEKRKPLYEAISHRINTDGLTDKQTANRILELYALESRD
ncbi:MAG TPA: shikimate kinase [Pontiellaceae bacterium]|nr:shikimate kinase [Pontiellaceae bacterium]